MSNYKPIHQKLQDILSRLENVRRSGEGYTARCPSHDDRHNSLSISAKDGRILIHCFAGCHYKTILSALGLTERDLFADDGDKPLHQRVGKAREKRGLTLAELAHAKRLGEKFLRDLGLRDVQLPTGPAVEIPYFDEHGTQIATRYRIALEGNRFRWKRGDSVAPYGLDRLEDVYFFEGWILLVEGESDCWTAWYHGIPALGIPGKDAWRSEWSTYLKGLKIYIWQEPDAEDFTLRIAKDLPDALVIRSEVAGAKDISEAHCAGQDIKELLERLKNEAIPAREILQRHASAEVESFPDESYQKDFRHAAILAELFVGSYRWATHRGSWMRYDGVRWRPEPEEAVAKEAMDALRVYYSVQLAKASNKAAMQGLVKGLQEVSVYSRITGILNTLKGWEGILTLPHEWDRDHWLLNCSNGTIDLRTGNLRLNKSDDLITNLAPVEYDPDASLPLWDRFLEDATGGDPLVKAFLQRVVGYMLTGDISEEVLFLILGPSSTGKTTFIEAIKATLGDYAKTANYETFLKRANTGAPRNDIARLAGARAVFATECERGKQLAEALTKALTGGDTIVARFLYREDFEFKPTFKLVFTANEAPHMKPDDDALWRRIIRIPFEAVIPEGKRDPQVKARLRDPKYAGPAILAWAVRGCLIWQQKGLGLPERIRDATRELRLEQNPLWDFITECCILDGERYTEAAKLRDAYENWARENGEEILSPKAVGKYLKACGCHRDVIREGGRTIRIWRGIALT